ncbi:D-alanyl-D-alanine carboxypeptidase family protein [Myceligenerans crystallogenes]|uniref:D-alanyl-D-alanine carboxypeptidase-like core domain-containing protein n=1 Tax=Myceligenerans crystallogenes TaxID=316335 RepID=A0ABP4ZMX7_9MICO
MSSPSDPDRRGPDGAGAAPSGGVRASGSFWSRVPGLALLRTHRRAVRRTASGLTGAIVAAAVLFVSGGSLPQGGGASYADTPLRSYAGAAEVLPAGRSADVTHAQVLAVLERAHQLAVQQGAALDPEIAQAAAELGMLYTTYKAQEEARTAEAPEGVPSGAPSAGVPSATPGAAPSGAPSPAPSGAGVPSQGPEGADGAPPEGLEGTGGKGGGQGSPAPGPTPSAKAWSATEVRNVRPRAGGVPTGGPGQDLPGATAGDSHDHDLLVTYDDVVTAAQRLARLMDPGLWDALVDPVPADGSGPAAADLRGSLESIVDAFGLSTAGYANGRIPADVLCPLAFAPGHLLRCDAAERLTALNAGYEQQFGVSIPITDSYRSYEAQLAVKAAKPYLAAVPGTSNHGWGIAVDFGSPIHTGVSAQYTWLRLHGPDFGWDNPVWARLDGSKPEPWHFEFFAAGIIPDRAVGVTDVGVWDDPRYKPPARPKPGEGAPAVPAGNDKGPGGPDGPSTDPGDGSLPSTKPPAPKPKPGPDAEPTGEPTGEPTMRPTKRPSPSPTGEPSGQPTSKPSASPSPSQKPSPSASPKPSPSASSSPSPSPNPSSSPGDVSCPDGSEPAASPTTATPSPSPSPSPTCAAADAPDATPSHSGVRSPAPSDEPSGGTTDALTGTPSTPSTRIFMMRRPR